jgi:predicted nucleotidyltransferase
MISAYENGYRAPTLATLARLVAAAGFDLVVDLKPTKTLDGRMSTPLGKRVAELSQSIVAKAAERGISNVRLFGSVARGEDHAGSDVDLLVDLGDDTSLLSLIGLQNDLSDLIGVPVDVVPASSLKPQLVEAVNPGAIKL